jgi:nitroreductase/FMN reductase (NADPH)/FMN reductase [NAD(P)H]
MEYIVHENGYKALSDGQLEAMWTPRAGLRPYDEYMRAFCNRKYNSDFSKEMTRSVGEYLKQFE